MAYSSAVHNLGGEARRDLPLRMAVSLAAVTELGSNTAALEWRAQSPYRPHIKWLKKLEAGEGEGQVITVEAEQYRTLHASRHSVGPDQEDGYQNQLELHRFQQERY